MVEYYYDVDDEVFKRVDNRGNHLAINIAEAQRIVSLVDLGYSAYKIDNKITLSNPKAGISTVKSFIKNYKDGNINIPDNAPAPTVLYEELSNDARLSNIEERIKKLEDDWEEFKSSESKGFKSKVKSWMS